MERVRRAKIVATLGPATDGLESDLVRCGLDVARLNFSHGAPADHARRCNAVRAAAANVGRAVAVMQDLQGPKIRVGSLVGGGPVYLEPGQDLSILARDVVGTAERIGCTYAGLVGDVRPGDRVLLDDGRIRLTVLDTQNGEVRTRVEEGGPLGEHKGINLPGVAVSAPAITEKDRADLAFGLSELHVDYVALSFIRTAAEVRAAQDLMRGLGRTVPCIVKLEKGEAIDNLDAILQVADGVMVARGDLGVELAPEMVPMLQKRIIQHANQRGIPVITATQMLESMITEETPTRAEASDVANAVWDGSDAVMLSAETATGRHPLVVVRMMDRIVRAAESADEPRVGRTRDERPRGYAAAVTHAARVLAEDLDASAIVGITRSGLTAELLSRGRARVPIFAFTPDPNVCARLALWWGVTPVQLDLMDALETNISAMEDHLVQSHGAAPADTVVITGSHPFDVGVHTNFVKYHVLGRAG
ncbi:MAG TPA: pyruvate kinase [Chloroflexota bacterium]